MRQYPTDYRLWGLISGGLFSPIVGVWLVSEGVGRLDRFILDLMYLAVACAAAGWIMHAVAVMCGVRLAGRPDVEQAANYDDAPKPPDR